MMSTKVVCIQHNYAARYTLFRNLLEKTLVRHEFMDFSRLQNEDKKLLKLKEEDSTDCCCSGSLFLRRVYLLAPAHQEKISALTKA